MCLLVNMRCCVDGKAEVGQDRASWYRGVAGVWQGCGRGVSEGQQGRTDVVAANVLARLSSSASTASLLSFRFTISSSGTGTKGSSVSATTCAA